MRTAGVNGAVVVIPDTVIVLPIPYALPPSIIFTLVIVPKASTVTFAFACEPTVEPANPTRVAP